MFVFDVIDFVNFDKNDVLWEFIDKDYLVMGNVLGWLEIFKIWIMFKSGSSVLLYKWYVVVVSGVNNYVSDGSVYVMGDFFIFILDFLVKFILLLFWVEGKNFWCIEFL